MRCDRDKASFVVSVVMLTISLGVGLIALLSTGPKPLPDHVLGPEFRQMFASQDTKYLTSSHVLLLATIAISAAVVGPLASWITLRWPAICRIDQRGIVSISGALLVVVAVAILVHSTTGHGGPHLYWPLQDPPGYGHVAFAIAALPTIMLAFHARWLSAALLAVGFAVLAFFLFWNANLTLNFVGKLPPDVVDSELHYNLMFGGSLNAVNGAGPVSGIYGVLAPSLLAVAMKMGAPISWGGVARLVVIGQIVTLGLLAGAAVFWARPGLKWLAVVLAAILAAPYLHPAHLSVVYPNQSAIRYAGMFACAILVAASSRLKVASAALLFGLLTPIALLSNLETGICGVLAMVVVLLTRNRMSDPKSHGIAFSLFLLGATASFLALTALLSVTLDHVDLTDAIVQQLREVAVRTVVGVQPSMNAVTLAVSVMMIHACWLTIRTAAEWNWTSLHPRSAALLGLSVMLLAWVNYFAYKAVQWNAWALFVVYLFILVEVFGRYRARLEIAVEDKGGFAASALLGGAGLLVVSSTVGAVSLTNFVKEMRNLYLSREQSASEQNFPRISGIVFSGVFPDAMQRKLSMVAEFAKSREVGYASWHNFIVHFGTGLSPKVPLIEPFVQAAVPGYFAMFIAELNSRGPEFILFDDPASEIRGPPPFVDFFRRVRAEISPCYREIELKEDWLVMQRNSDCKAQ